MSNSYKYVDSEHTYIDPKTGLLKNLFNIEDEETLIFVESGAVTKRLQELYEKSFKITGVNDLFEIHRLLFQDIYEWAGKKRLVEISKTANNFFLLIISILLWLI